MRRITKGTVGATAIGVACIVGWTIFAGPSSSQDPNLERQLEASYDAFVESVTTNSPTPSLPPDQRALWIEAWNKMSACADGLGMGDRVSEVSPNFGDGNTPVPYVSNGNASNGAEIAAKCPFDGSQLDMQVLETAMDEANAELSRPDANPSPLSDEMKQQMLETYDLSAEFLAQAEVAMRVNDPALYASFPDSGARQAYIREDINNQLRDSLGAGG